MSNMRAVKKWIGWLAVLGCSVNGLAAGTFKALPEYKEALDKALKEAGDNRAELVKALDEVPAEQNKGMQFLIAYMPASDWKTVKSQMLLNNVKWAYKARTTFGWAKDVPEEIFLNDVLPYASLDEPRDDWRADFFKRFSKYVKDAKNQHEALMAVSNNIVKEVKVEYNTKRKRANQSPYESMEQGMASCSGLSILLIDAFRAVGIPARMAGIPAWTTKRGNHNWVEVWTTADKRWRFTEYYPDKNGLDHGWLLADAARANANSFYHSVYASSWKPTGKHFPLVWNMRSKDVPALNVTERYVKLGADLVKQDVCELRVHYMTDGKRSEVPVMVIQGDARIGSGQSPKPTDDMNRYFTANVRKGQIYQIIWKDPATGKQHRKSVKTPSDKDWVVVELPGE